MTVVFTALKISRIDLRMIKSHSAGKRFDILLTTIPIRLDVEDFPFLLVQINVHTHAMILGILSHIYLLRNNVRCSGTRRVIRPIMVFDAASPYSL